jgi:hypothetical protein
LICDDSIILNESNRKNEFLNKLYEWSGYKSMKLIYRSTRDGKTSKAFHDKCDNQGNTICLYKNDKDYIFGGYASIPWTEEGEYHFAPDSFIFTLDVRTLFFFLKLRRSSDDPSTPPTAHHIFINATQFFP